MKIDLLLKIESLFWENAFAELSMDDIGKALGIKKSSLYYHFPSKDHMFSEVLEYSYTKYKEFISSALQKDSLRDIVVDMISFPLSAKNLFSVVLQKGYCKNDSVREFIEISNSEISKIFLDALGSKYSMSKERIIVFRSVIDDLGKRNCTMGCGNSTDFDGVVAEIVKLFSK